jgi:hypothetical protein
MARRSGAQYVQQLFSQPASFLPGDHQLIPRPRGALNNLTAAAVAAPAHLQAGQVVVAVKATGINFRDVLNILNMYPGDAGNPGSDCSGKCAGC